MALTAIKAKPAVNLPTDLRAPPIDLPKELNDSLKSPTNGKDFLTSSFMLRIGCAIPPPACVTNVPVWLIVVPNLLNANALAPMAADTGNNALVAACPNVVNDLVPVPAVLFSVFNRLFARFIPLTKSLSFNFNVTSIFLAIIWLTS